MKECTGCGDMTSDYSPDKRATDGLMSKCRVCRREESVEHTRLHGRTKRQTVNNRRYAQSGKGMSTNRAWRETIEGHLRNMYASMKSRCGVYANYVTVECRFASPEDLIDYVVNNLGVDPRGLDCHRIDNGHYERGNIEFLTKKEHVAAHMKIKELV